MLSAVIRTVIVLNLISSAISSNQSIGNVLLNQTNPILNLSAVHAPTVVSSNKTNQTHQAPSVPDTASPCIRPNLGNTSVIGLMVTKEDGKILAEWLLYNMPSLKALVIFDSSEEDAQVNIEIIRRYQEMCPASKIDLLHERDFPLKYSTDQAMRYHPHRFIRQRYGANHWIMVCHADEFFYHEPQLIAQDIVHVGSRCNTVRWNAPQVVPHPVEYGRWHYHDVMKKPELLQTRFQYMRYGCKDGAIPVTKEVRLFYDLPQASYSLEKGTHGIAPTSNETNLCDFGATYLHYKVAYPDTSVYNSAGKHTKHWGGNGGPSVGTGHEIHNNRDFFVSQFRDCRYSALFDGCSLASTTYQGWNPAPEKFKVRRIWPTANVIANNGSSCTPQETKVIKRAKMNTPGIRVGDIMPSTASHVRLLSIIIPYYNDHLRLKYLLDLIRTYPPYPQVEFIIVDDGSQKEKAMDLFENIEPFYNMNVSLLTIHEDIPWNQPGAKNLGAAFASSKWLTFLDLDTEFGVAAFHGLMMKLHQLTTEPELKQEKISVYFPRQTEDGARFGEYHPSACMVRSSTFWGVIGGFDELFSGEHGHEDSLFRHQLKKEGISVVIAEEAVLTSMSRVRTSLSRGGHLRNPYILEYAKQIRSLDNYQEKQLPENIVLRFSYTISYTS